MPLAYFKVAGLVAIQDLLFVSLFMAKSSSLQKQLSVAERFVTESALHGDTHGAEEASARCASIRSAVSVEKMIWP
jgi:hypothetical protein